jgi:hypothetical protein
LACAHAAPSPSGAGVCIGSAGGGGTVCVPRRGGGSWGCPATTQGLQPGPGAGPGRSGELGIVQIWLFLGNTTDPGRAFGGRSLAPGGRGRLVRGETLIAEQFRPVGMALAGEDFRGASAGPLGALTPREAAVVKEYALRAQPRQQARKALQPKAEDLRMCQSGHASIRASTLSGANPRRRPP